MGPGRPTSIPTSGLCEADHALVVRDDGVVPLGHRGDHHHAVDLRQEDQRARPGDELRLARDGLADLVDGAAELRTKLRVRRPETAAPP